MARSHHRKKHKSHLKQFKQSQETSSPAKSKAKAAWVLAIGGAIVGFAVSYFASDGAPLWLAVATLAAGVAGYYVGKKMDDTNNKE